MQAQTPEVSSEKATTPRYDTIVIKGAKGQNVPKEVDGGEVVAWSVGHGLAAMDALEEFVDDLAAGNCHQPAYLNQGAADAMNLMRRRRVLGWDADEPTGQPPADWKTAVALAVATAHHVFEDCDEEARNAIEYLAALMLASEPADTTEQPQIDWTYNKPTQPGAYWIRGNLLRADALIEVKRVDNELWCNLHLVNTEHRIEYGFTIDQLSPDFEWLGPLQAQAELSGRVVSGDGYSINCWSCKSTVSLDERADADGNCPHCRVELDLEEYLRALLAAAPAPSAGGAE